MTSCGTEEAKGKKRSRGGRGLNTSKEATSIRQHRMGNRVDGKGANSEKRGGGGGGKNSQHKTRPKGESLVSNRGVTK